MDSSSNSDESLGHHNEIRVLIGAQSTVVRESSVPADLPIADSALEQSRTFWESSLGCKQPSSWIVQEMKVSTK